MPALAFASNFLWVMVLGLLGPSIPAILPDLGISYGQAGLFFTLLSLGSLLGTSLGAAASDLVPRKVLFGGCIAALCVGLAVLGFMPSYVLVALLIFIASLLGSPIGAIGQSIMLDMFPRDRERNLSLMASFAACGNFVAPILVSLNYTAGLGWRWPFVETAALALALFVALMVVPIPRAAPEARGEGILVLLKNGRVLFCAVLIFVSVAADLGFSYWLAEYFSAELHVSIRLSSSVVGMYLAGLIVGRFVTPLVLRRVRKDTVLIAGLGIAIASIFPFILARSVPLKAVLCALYGLGIGPVFPLLMAWGSWEFPSRSGAVTGVLYGFLSLGGMVFPLLVGLIAARVGIAHSFFFCAAAAIALLLALGVQRLAAVRPWGAGSRDAGAASGGAASGASGASPTGAVPQSPGSPSGIPRRGRRPDRPA